MCIRDSLETARKLGQRDHRRLELTGQDLEAPADLGHLHLAVLRPCPTGHELEIIDHHHAEVAFGLPQPTGAGADVHDGHGRIVVDEDWCAVESTHSDAELPPVILLEPAGPDTLSIDTRLRGQQALTQLQVAHFEGEQEARPLEDHAHVGQDSKGQAGFSRGGPGSDDGEAGRLQSRQDLVEVGVPLSLIHISSQLELRSTLIVRFAIDEGSAKVRTGGPVDEDEDLALPIWAGQIPFDLVAGTGIAEPDLPDGTAVPPYATRYPARGPVRNTDTH